MKKPTLKLLFAAGTIALLSSCTKEIAGDIIIGNGEAQTLAVTLSAEQPLQTNNSAATSRSKIEFDEVAGKVNITWRSGNNYAQDRLFVYGADEAFILTEGADTKSGTFDGTLSLQAGKSSYIYAIYNGSEDMSENYDSSNFTSDNGSISHNFTLPIRQEHGIDADGNSSVGAVGKYSMMYSRSNSEVSSNETSTSLTMHHATAFQQLRFTNLPTDKKLDYIEYISSSPIAMQYRVNLDTNEGQAIMGDTPTNNIRVKITNSANSTRADGNASVIFALFPQTLPAGSIATIRVRFADGTGGQIVSQPSENEVIYTAGELYRSPATFDYTTFSSVFSTSKFSDFTATSAPDADVWIISDTAATLGEINALNSSLDYINSQDNGRRIVVELPELTSIPEKASLSSLALKSITMPKITTIGASLFKDNTSLQNVTAPLLSTIGGSAFVGCTALTSLNGNANFDVNLPYVTSIEYQTFWKCSAIKSINIPKVEMLAGDVFKGSGITKMTLATESTSVCIRNNATADPFGPSNSSASKINITIKNGVTGISADGNNLTIARYKDNEAVASLTKAFKSIIIID